MFKSYPTNRYDPFGIGSVREGKALGFFSPRCIKTTEKPATPAAEVAVKKKKEKGFFDHPFDIPLEVMKRPRVPVKEQLQGKVKEAWLLWRDDYSQSLRPITSTAPDSTKPSTAKELAAVSRLYEMRGCPPLSAHLATKAPK